MNIDQIILNSYRNMVDEISNTVSEEILPHKYHKTANIAEINSVYQFTKYIDINFESSSVYFEYPCDSGRVDAVVLIDNNILLIEAKSEMSNKKYKELNAQASRFEHRSPLDDIEFSEEWLKK